MSDLTIALDAMGGDSGPSVTVPAAMQALSYLPHLKLIIFGESSVIESYLASAPADIRERIEVSHTSVSITMDASPLTVLKKDRESSMQLALKAVKNGQAQACVSAGNTGALVALAKYILRPIEHIRRIALVSAIPNQAGGMSYFLDLGANVSCDGETLYQFALMGSVMAETIADKPNPKVALLNVGAEANKGHIEIKIADQLLRQSDTINYSGYIEGDAIFTGQSDVIVCDGFTGNITLKTGEGLVKLVLEEVIASLKHSILTRIAAQFINRHLKKRLTRLKPDQYNGASLLGLRGIVVKSHGHANVSAFANAIYEAVRAAEQNVPARIAEQLEMQFQQTLKK